MDAFRTVQTARRLLAHSSILCFMMEAGLNRQRLEFAAADLKGCCERLTAELQCVPTVQQQVFTHLSCDGARPSLQQRLWRGWEVNVTRTCAAWFFLCRCCCAAACWVRPFSRSWCPLDTARSSRRSRWRRSSAVKMRRSGWRRWESALCFPLLHAT